MVLENMESIVPSCETALVDIGNHPEGCHKLESFQIFQEI